MGVPRQPGQEDLDVPDATFPCPEPTTLFHYDQLGLGVHSQRLKPAVLACHTPDRGVERPATLRFDSALPQPLELQGQEPASDQRVQAAVTPLPPPAPQWHTQHTARVWKSVQPSPGCDAFSTYPSGGHHKANLRPGHPAVPLAGPQDSRRVAADHGSGRDVFRHD